ncbi:MAG: sensor histidine kinase [Vicinamibacterales bacterium]
MVPVWRTAPAWTWAAAVALVGFTAAELTGLLTEPARLSTSAARLVFEGAAFLWAAARRDAPSRFRLALTVTGWTSLVTAVSYLLLVPAALGGPRLVSPLADTLFTVFSYVGAVAALVVYPRAPARRHERTALAIDLLITAGGLGVMSWALVTAPSAALAGGSQPFTSVIVYGLAQLSLVVSLNLVVVRGLPIPSRRAFWWFVAGQATYIPVVVLAQFELASRFDPGWGAMAYYLGVVPTLVAAVYIRHDAMARPGVVTGPRWIADFNPLPIVTPLAVGGGLFLALAVGPASAALPLAATLVVVSLLLSLRLLLSARHAAERARLEAEAERRRQRDKMQAVARLAGGVAHEFNNLMTRVIGHAELGEDLLAPGADARVEFGRIRTAAERAAALTAQLLAFSGRQRSQLDRIDLTAWLHRAGPAATASVPAAVDVDLQVPDERLEAWADGAQLTVALGQITANAVEAMPDGGRLRIELARHDLDGTIGSPLLRVPAGRYAAVRVRDTGRGIPPEHLSAICEPFFSTKAPHLAAGLGLASVYGIVAAHGGGLDVESVVDRGTTVSIYLPLA